MRPHPSPRREGRRPSPEKGVDMVLGICLVAIVAAIIIGWKFKLNVGVLGMCLAFIIGFFGVGMSISDIINFWPITITFYIVVVSLFFNYANENGTVELLAKKLIVAMKGNAKLIPFAIALACAIIGAIGGGPATPGIMSPFAFSIGLTAGVHPMLIAVCVLFGTMIGINNPINGMGIIVTKGIVTDPSLYAMDVDPAAVDAQMNFVYLNGVIICLVLIIIYYLIFRGFKAQKFEMDMDVPAFNSTQKKTLAVVIIGFCFMLFPALLKAIIPNDVTIALAGVCQPQVIMALGAFVCAVMKLAPEKKVVKSIPINTIVTILGMYMLIKVASEAGLVDAITSLLHGSIPALLIPAALCIFAAFLAFFSSVNAVVLPLMLPLIPALVSGFGLNSTALISCVLYGGVTGANSPFSTAGGLLCGGCNDERARDALPNQMIIIAITATVMIAILSTIGIFNLFSVEGA